MKGVFLSLTDESTRRLRLKTVHDIDDEDGDVAERRSTGSQVGERLVSGRVNDEETGHLVLEWRVLVEDSGLGLEHLGGEVGGTDLLGDTTSFALLNVV